MNVKKRYPSWQMCLCMNLTQGKKLKSLCQLYKQMLQDAVISEIHKISGVLHFLEIIEMRGIFQTLIEAYNVFPASSASAERSFSRQIKRYTRATINEI